MPAATLEGNVPKMKEPLPPVWDQLFSPDEIYTAEEIAEKLKATPRQVRRWCDEGRLPYVNLPKGRRISGQAMIDFLRGRSSVESESR